LTGFSSITKPLLLLSLSLSLSLSLLLLLSLKDYYKKALISIAVLQLLLYWYYTDEPYCICLQRYLAQPTRYETNTYGI